MLKTTDLQLGSFSCIQLTHFHWLHNEVYKVVISLFGFWFHEYNSQQEGFVHSVSVYLRRSDWRLLILTGYGVLIISDLSDECDKSTSTVSLATLACLPFRAR